MAQRLLALTGFVAILALGYSSSSVADTTESTCTGVDPSLLTDHAQIETNVDCVGVWQDWDWLHGGVVESCAGIRFGDGRCIGDYQP